MSNSDILLHIENLKNYFYLDSGVIKAVDGVSFDIKRGRTLGIIGESGCGKSVTAHSIMRLLPNPPAKTVDGKILLYLRDREPVDLAKLDHRGDQIRQIRGKHIGMIFQEPMTSFGPLHTIGDQIVEAIRIHFPEIPKLQAVERTIDLLRQVGIPKAEERINAYPHQFSGGMRQRAMIAMALSCSPELLIADEPTTSLDVTIEAQILELLRNLQQEREMSIMLITHNLAVVSEVADDIGVMYLGKRVEYSSAEQIAQNPLHPYTQGLWGSIPQLEGELTRLVPVRGSVPSPHERPPGCVFGSRCDHFMSGICDANEPPDIEVEPGHIVSCHKFA